MELHTQHCTANLRAGMGCVPLAGEHTKPQISLSDLPGHPEPGVSAPSQQWEMFLVSLPEARASAGSHSHSRGAEKSSQQRGRAFCCQDGASTSFPPWPVSLGKASSCWGAAPRCPVAPVLSRDVWGPWGSKNRAAEPQGQQRPELQSSRHSKDPSCRAPGTAKTRAAEPQGQQGLTCRTQGQQGPGCRTPGTARTDLQSPRTAGTAMLCPTTHHFVVFMAGGFHENMQFLSALQQEEEGCL